MTTAASVVAVNIAIAAIYVLFVRGHQISLEILLASIFGVLIIPWGIAGFVCIIIWLCGAKPSRFIWPWAITALIGGLAILAAIGRLWAVAGK